MKIKPLYDRILLEPIKEPEQRNGVFVPQSSSDKSLMMTIVSIGEGCEELFSVGEKIILHKFAGIEVNHNGQKMIIAKAIDVLAKVEDSNETI